MSGSSTGWAELAEVLPKVWFSEKWESTAVFDRETLSMGTTITGPALITERTTVTVIEPGWRGEITKEMDLLLTRTAPRAIRSMIDTESDPVLLEVFNNLFMSISEQICAVLQNAAYSVNIKERLDFSCALFDAQRRLLSNSPHIPLPLLSLPRPLR